MIQGGGPGTEGAANVDERRVEERRGGLGHAATLRFPSPLIERSMQISSSTLSDWLHREAHGGGPRCTRTSRCTPKLPYT